jgi:hypothetical protein
MHAAGRPLRNTVLLDETRVLNPDGLRWPTSSCAKVSTCSAISRCSSLDRRARIEAGHALYHRLVAACSRPPRLALREAGRAAPRPFAALSPV